MYKTLDGLELNEGDSCYVHVQDPSRQRQLTRLFKAHYMDDTARDCGWDFTIEGLPEIKDADYAWEVTAVYKNKPVQSPVSK